MRGRSILGPWIVLLWALADMTAAQGESGDLSLSPSFSHPECVACREEARADVTMPTSEELASLEKGEILTSERRVTDEGEGIVSQVRATALVDARPEEVWSVLADFESRPSYFRDLQAMKIVKIDDRKVWLDEELKFLWVKIHYRVLNSLHPESGLLHFELDKSVPHDIENTKGTWRLIPHGSGSTLVFYAASINTGKPVPAFLERFLVKRSLPGIVGALREEVARRRAIAASSS